MCCVEWSKAAAFLISSCSAISSRASAAQPVLCEIEGAQTIDREADFGAMDTLVDVVLSQDTDSQRLSVALDDLVDYDENTPPKAKHEARTKGASKSSAARAIDTKLEESKVVYLCAHIAEAARGEAQGQAGDNDSADGLSAADAAHRHAVDEHW